MSPRLPLGGVLVLLCAAASQAGDPPPPGSAAPIAAPIASPSGAESVNPLLVSPAGAVAHDWSAELLFGLPTGLRAQHRLGVDGTSPWLVEGFLGFELIFPGVGGGVRRRLEVLQGERHSLVISPGVDGYVFYNTFYTDRCRCRREYPVLGMAAADVDFIWQHRVCDSWDGMLGLKLGAGVAGGNGVGVLPLVAVFAGWCF